MAEIPAWLWIGAGIIVTATALYVGEGLRLFFYAGLLFIIFGVAKLSIKFVTKKETPAERKMIQRQMPKAAHQPYKRCYRCAQYIRKTDNFCWCCGVRQR